MRTRYAALAATFVLLAALAATLLLTSNGAPQPTSTAQQTAPHSPRDAPATPVTPQPPDRCTTPTDPTCIRAVYKGAPDDYAQVQDIPASVLIQPDDDGRYQVERGQQITVVTAAPLPTGYTRFYLQRQPLQVTVSPTSSEQLIQPVGTTYTFTVAANEAGSNLITFNLTEARPRPRPGQKPELGDVVVTTKFLVPTLRYDTLDITGAATTPGSYAFLKTAGDAASATDNVYRDSFYLVELRLHTIDASGALRSAFYDTVQVNDTFDFQTNGLDCGYRFKVTSLIGSASTRGFGIEHVSEYGGRCGDAVDDPGARKNVTLVWEVPSGIPDQDGVQSLLRDEPTGEGSYRIFRGIPFVIDVPAGSTIVLGGYIEHALEGDDPNPIAATIVLFFDESGSRSTLHIDPLTGREAKRVTKSPGAAVLFDQIMASIRRVD